jgi:hypothetical protein
MRGQRLGKRGGLSETRASCLGEVPLHLINALSEPVGFPLQAIPLLLQTIPVLLERVMLALGALTPFVDAQRVGGLPQVRHALVMPESAVRYKTSLINYDHHLASS